MNNYNNNRHKNSPREISSRPSLPRRILLHLGKQILAAGLCFLLVLAMSHGSSTHLKNYTAALGRALRYESDLGWLQEKGAVVYQQFSSENPPLESTSNTGADSITEH